MYYARKLVKYTTETSKCRSSISNGTSNATSNATLTSLRISSDSSFGYIIGNFQMKNVTLLLFFARDIDCEFTLDALLAKWVNQN